MNRTLRASATGLVLALAGPAVARAQVTQSVALYAPALQVTGSAQVGNATTEVDVSASELLDKLELGGVAGYRLETPRWSFIAGAAYVGLGQSKGDLSIDVDLFLAELDGGYRLTEAVEVLLGVRYTAVGVRVEGTKSVSSKPVDVKNTDSFVDPIVGMRFATPISRSGKWMVQGRGDVGGFGIGMDLQWQALLDFGYRPGDAWAFWLGYRALSQDFEDAGEHDVFAMNVVYQGPQFGVTFAF